RVLRVSDDEGGRERAQRHHGLPVRSEVVQRAPHQPAPEPLALEPRLDLGVDEDDDAGLAAVADHAAELTLDPDLVAQLGRIVDHRDLHLSLHLGVPGRAAAPAELTAATGRGPAWCDSNLRLAP